MSVHVFILVLFIKSIFHLCLCHLLQPETRSTTISQMFSKATKAFVKDTDHNGRLIPVSSLNDTDKLNLRSLIVKTRPRCFWQEPKYQSPGFTLSDVLKPREPGDSPLSPTVKECDFVDYSGTFGDKKEMNADGNVQAKVADFKFTVGGKWFTKQKLSLGSLNKEKVDVKELLDMSHCLIQQTCEKAREVFAVVKERIVTTQPCSVIKVQQRGKLEKLSSHFQLLSALPAATRSSLLQLLKTTMEDGEAVSVLESV
ncbi:unnamed protein product, partial [Coregonus sp. 'balchen']